jgi:hypothetical protein
MITIHNLVILTRPHVMIVSQKQTMEIVYMDRNVEIMTNGAFQLTFFKNPRICTIPHPPRKLEQNLGDR